jgi:ribonuclease Z
LGRRIIFVMRSSFFVHAVNGSFGDPAFYLRVAHRREALLFDCGDLHALTSRDLLKIKAVFLSHAHIDHLSGFDRLLRSLLYRVEPLQVYGPTGVIERIGHRLAGYTWNLVRSYPLSIEVNECGTLGITRTACFAASTGFRVQPAVSLTVSAGLIKETPHYQVRGALLDHGDIPSLAFCLEEKIHVAIHGDALAERGYQPGRWLTHFKDLLRTQESDSTILEVPHVSGNLLRRTLKELKVEIAHCEPGMKIVYVTDASPTQANAEKIITLATEAHLLIIEATFAQQDWDLACTRNHLTAALAGELARRARARKTLFFHHSPRYQKQPQRLHKEAMAAFSGSITDS